MKTLNKKYIAIVGLLFVTLVPFASQGSEKEKKLIFGNDLFSIGQNITIDQKDIGDAFAISQNLSNEFLVRGSAHMFGQNVIINEEVYENVYAAGQTVTVNGLFLP